MSQLTIVANITAKPEHIAKVKTALLKLVDITRTEAGCLTYDLHQDNDNPAQFMFYENWQSRAMWLAHMEMPHLKEYAATTEGLIETFSLNEMSLLN